MIVGWLVYSLLIGVLLTAAARLFEGGLLGMGRPTRWVWLIAMLVTIAAPPLLMWAPAEAPAAPLAVITSLPAIEFAAPPAEDGGWLPPLRSVLVGGWAVLSVVVLAIAGGSVVRVARRRRQWQRQVVDGVSVLVSSQTGPAVVGVRRCEIVIPEWALSLSATERAFMLRHEEEHARAADPRLLFAAVLLCALVPWNVFVWYQLRRLVIAIEVDCDRRVLAGGGDVGAYAKLLLDFGQRLSHTMLPVTAFAEPVSILERRIRHMTARRPRRRIMRLLGTATAGVAFVTVAAALPVPREASLDELRLRPEASVPDALLPPAREAAVMQTDTPPGKASIEAGPVFTPYTTPPTLKNKEAVGKVLEENYPPVLRDAGIGGTVGTWFLLDENGRVLKTEVQKSSGRQELDAAAIRVAGTMEFTPALNRGQPVKVWVAMPIVFKPPVERANEEFRKALQNLENEAAAAYRRNAALVKEAAGDSRSEKEGAGGFTVAPVLVNGSDVAAMMQRAYPPLLRDAGIGGEVFVIFDIDETGRVTRAVVGESSGHPSLDEAALRVAPRLRFAPARRGNRPVATKLGLPLAFQSQ